MSNSEQNNWQKRINVFLVGIAIPLVIAVIDFFNPEIKCSLGITIGNCANKHCQNLFQTNKRIEVKYRPIRRDHIEVGTVEILNVTPPSKAHGITEVEGKATLLEHSFSVDTDIAEPMLVGDINFSPYKNHKPLNFNITYNETGKWKLRWASKAGVARGEDGICETGKAWIYMKHPTLVDREYKLVFQLIP